MAGFVASAALVCALAAPAAADRTALGDGPAQVAPHFTSSTGLISVVDPASINCTQTTTFDDVDGGAAPGANYDSILNSIGVSFAERFTGQALTYSTDFDVVSGAPNNPLALQAGLAGQNLNVFNFSTNVLDGLGNLGFPNFSAIGEGSVSMYFSAGQSQLSFQLVGGDGGSAQLDFYRADGSLIDSIVLSGLANTSYGFQRLGGTQDIAGVLIQNTDLGGIGIDDVCHDVGVVPTRPTTWGSVKHEYR